VGRVVFEHASDVVSLFFDVYDSPFRFGIGHGEEA
jgi:hypothetical protein